jgi:spermidine synthase
MSVLSSDVQDTAIDAPDEAALFNRVRIVDVADIPGGGYLTLLRWRDSYSIEFGTEELMGSSHRTSEQALATLACARLGDPRARVLIGGLGMGFTLGAALKALPAGASVVVAELVPKIVEWARGPLAHLFGDHLDDPRLSLEIVDVHDAIDRNPARFDAILLDVDNGPDGLIQLANDRLYCNWGLRSAYAALRPGGILAIWSAYADDAFADRLTAAGFAVDTVTMPANDREDAGTHVIWFGTRAG